MDVFIQVNAILRFRDFIIALRQQRNGVTAQRLLIEKRLVNFREHICTAVTVGRPGSHAAHITANLNSDNGRMAVGKCRSGQGGCHQDSQKQ